MYQVSHRAGEQFPLPVDTSRGDGVISLGREVPAKSAWTDVEDARECERPLIAIVEDDSATVEMLTDLLALSGYRTLLINRGESAYSVIRDAQPHLVLLDLWLEHHDAGSMAAGLLSIDPATAHIPIILCSAQVGAYRARNDQVVHKAAAIVEKPFAIDELLTTIEAILDGTISPANRAQ
jgi:DNA-binding response OmpR family regulator